mmetsp:Transcript_12240/g.16197  ORF Transcript_12240/g.16197 Transcript_12240/m.16197 type:complete len:216 (-) Transcript_12240:298-945(-)|eukprot:CAMPEP_0185780268 /NCGR_PEP_ID=MMETSP1174-20130828/98552_1 /TAXON_ID=35687 /ORGANISM="Dictyocha speculum, Strain CCMP1381" /LENGTH=215 /DNA_ID=CAMNT_0028469763 /DNA_START=58 /DNA_END=705 /DNA_ORIENTATION=+
MFGSVRFLGHLHRARATQSPLRVDGILSPRLLSVFFSSARQKQRAILNENIIAKDVRLIIPQSGEHEIISLSEALGRAKSMRLDLVAVAPDANPVVCKIMDYNKENFKKKQRSKDQAKERKAKNVGSKKEVTMRALIEDHDLRVKVGKVSSALAKGHPVEVLVSCSYRMLRQKPESLNAFPERIYKVLEESSTEYTTIKESRTPTSVGMVLMPKV